MPYVSCEAPRSSAPVVWSSTLSVPEGLEGVGPPAVVRSASGEVGPPAAVRSVSGGLGGVGPPAVVVLMSRLSAPPAVAPWRPCTPQECHQGGSPCAGDGRASHPASRSESALGGRRRQCRTCRTSPARASRPWDM